MRIHASEPVVSAARGLSLPSAVLAAALVGAPASALAGPYSSLFVFGDSLSDTGNLFALTGGTVPSPTTYFNGRVSDGRVAVEYLADGLGLSGPAVRNFAVAGARTDADGEAPGTGLASQVSAFLGVAPLIPSVGSGLFVVWAGANDFRGSLGLTDPTAAWAGIYNNLGSAISQLYVAGAREFLLPNLPNIGLTPEGLASGASPLISMLAGGFNVGLAAAYGGLQPGLPGAVFRTIDVFAAQTALLAGAPANGITNIGQGCLVPLPGLPASTDPCSASFFVDNIHPTTRVHAVLGDQMLAAVVPEPGSVLLVATAVLGLLSASARRRRSVA